MISVGQTNVKSFGYHTSTTYLPADLNCFRETLPTSPPTQAVLKERERDRERDGERER